jgi:hypothetical protein
MTTRAMERVNGQPRIRLQCLPLNRAQQRLHGRKDLGPLQAVIEPLESRENTNPELI